jgi:toluene monooxygenase system protein B
VSEPYPIPVNGLFGSDFVHHLVLLMSSDTIAEAAQKVAHHSVGRRITPRESDMALYYQGRVVAPDLSVAEAGIAPLQHVFVDYVDQG